MLGPKGSLGLQENVVVIMHRLNVQILRKLHNLSVAVNEYIQNIGRLGISACRAIHRVRAYKRALSSQHSEHGKAKRYKIRATHGVRVYKRALSSHATWRLNMQTLHKLDWRMKFMVQLAWLAAKLTAWLDVYPHGLAVAAHETNYITS